MGKLDKGPVQTVLSTGLNSLANGAGAISSAVDNSKGAGGRYPYADFELTATFASSPTAGSQVELYVVPSMDNSTFADGSASVFSVDNYVGGFHVRAVGTQQVISVRNVPLPPGYFKVQVKNSSGQALTASGHTLKMLPYSESTV